MVGFEEVTGFRKEDCVGGQSPLPPASPSTPWTSSPLYLPSSLSRVVWFTSIGGGASRGLAAEDQQPRSSSKPSRQAMTGSCRPIAQSSLPRIPRMLLGGEQGWFRRGAQQSICSVPLHPVLPDLIDDCRASSFSTNPSRPFDKPPHPFSRRAIERTTKTERRQIEKI